MKLRPVGDKLFHEDRQTDGHDSIRHLSQFCERAYIYYNLVHGVQCRAGDGRRRSVGPIM